MSAKAVTTGLLIAGLMCLVSGPVLLGPRPQGREALARYSVQFGVYILVTALSMVGAAAGAIVVARQERERYQEESRANFEDLIEGTLHAHRRGPEDREHDAR